MSKLERLKAIALEAGEIIRDGYYKSKQITHKGVVDLVTQYDVAVEEFILSRLSKEFPEYTLVGEESHKGSYFHDKAIYIDPIDGTTNFVHGFPHLGVSIGVWENSQPVLGVVYNPILDELFYAEQGKGAYLNGEKIETSKQAQLQQSLIATGFPYAKVEQGIEYHWVIDTMRNILPHIRDIRRLGAAALDLCYLASGKVDGFYEIDLKPWDVSAGILILQEAGGKISNVNADAHSLDDKSIVASNGYIHEQLLEKLEKI